MFMCLRLLSLPISRISLLLWSTPLWPLPPDQTCWIYPPDWLYSQDQRSSWKVRAVRVSKYGDLCDLVFKYLTSPSVYTSTLYSILVYTQAYWSVMSHQLTGPASHCWTSLLCLTLTGSLNQPLSLFITLLRSCEHTHPRSRHILCLFCSYFCSPWQPPTNITWQI